MYPHPIFPYSPSVYDTYDLDENWRTDYPLIIDYNKALDLWFNNLHFSFQKIFN